MRQSLGLRLGHGRWIFSVTLATLVGVAVNFVHADEQAASTGARLTENPFAAHNAYPWRSYPPRRFERALDSGLKYIEIDVTYDDDRNAVIATHDSRPRGGETELGELLGPLWETWGQRDGNGYILIIDFKSTSPALAKGLHAVLEPYAALLSTMEHGAPETFREGKITVCLTGSDACQVLYAKAVGRGGRLLAFGDYGTSEWKDDPADYVPQQAPDFDRFLTFNIGCFRKAKDARGRDAISDERLETVVELANQRGYLMRVWTLNPPRRDSKLDDRVWRQCADAGVHMISTDYYEIAVEWWADYVAEHSGAGQ